MDELTEMKAAIFKALGHPLRLAIMEFLAGGERSVGEIVEHIGAEPSNTSRHLAMLRQLGMLADRREGLNVYYRHTMDCFGKLASCVSEGVRQQLTNRQQLLERL